MGVSVGSSIYNALGIYESGAGGGGGGGGGGFVPLPTGYTFLEKLNISGTQGIKIDFVNKRTSYNDVNLLDVFVELVYKELSSSKILIQIEKNDGIPIALIGDNAQYDTFKYNNWLVGDYPGIRQSDYLNKDLILNIYGNSLKINDNAYSIHNPSALIKYYAIGSLSGNLVFDMDIKNIMMYYQGKLIFMGITCIRDLDGVEGVYNPLEDEFIQKA